MRKDLNPALFVILAVAMEAGALTAQSVVPVAPSSQPDTTAVAGPFQDTVCAPDAITLCLNGGRFKAQVNWSTAQGSGVGTAVPLTSDTGYFWFFDETNTEVVLKVLDGCALNQSFWVFAAGLTDVDVIIAITDTRTGAVVTYRNLLGRPFAPIQDISAFRTCGAAAGEAAVKSTPPDRGPEGGKIGRISSAAATSTSQPVCLPSSTRLCLDSERFSVEATWTTPDGKTGQGQAVPLSANTGYFWFFDRNNVEMVIKVLRGCSLNQRFWVYAAGLTNVEVTFKVTDVITGKSQTYHNPANRAFLPVQDTSSLAACLPSCNSKGLTVADVQSAAEQSMQGTGDPFGADFKLVLNRFMALESCDLAGDSAPTAPPPGAAGRDCGNFFCGDVQYCGPGNSQKNWSLGVLSVRDALNGACFQQDTCYTGQCYPSDCYFLSGLTGSCDQPLLAACDSILQNQQSACGNAGDCLVCAIAKSLYNVVQNPRATPNDCQEAPCADPLGLVCNQSAGRCASGCVTAISPIRQSIGSTGGSGSVSITAPAGCDWTPVSEAGWITVISGSGGSGGSGKGSFIYSVAASDTSQRTGSVAVGGQSLVVTQDSAPCSYSFDPPEQSFGTEGGIGSVSVTAHAGCPWTAKSLVGWIIVLSGDSGNGQGTVRYAVANSNTFSQRSGVLLIGGQFFTVTQDGALCSYSIAPTSQAFGGSGGSGSVTVKAPFDCPWAAESNADWITVTAGSGGNGSGTVTYSVAAEDTAIPRAGSLTIAGQTFTITQAGASCSSSISPAGEAFGASGGGASVAVTALPGCDWTAASNDDWITVTSAGGSGDGTVSFSVAANDGGNPRTGSLTIAGQIFTVTQDGAPCVYSISPSSAFFGAEGGSDSVSVTAPRDCEWTAASDSAWITITSGDFGSGNGTVTYFVSFNPDTETETGSLTIAGSTFLVTQAGQPPQ